MARTQKAERDREYYYNKINQNEAIEGSLIIIILIIVLNIIGCIALAYCLSVRLASTPIPS